MPVGTGAAGGAGVGGSASPTTPIISMRVERVDRGVVLDERQVILERQVVGIGSEVLLERPHIPLDDLAGVLLVQLVVAIGREIRS